MVSIVPRIEEGSMVWALMKLLVAKQKEEANINPARASQPSKAALLSGVKGDGIKIQAHDHKKEENQHGARVDQKQDHADKKCFQQYKKAGQGENSDDQGQNVIQGISCQHNSKACKIRIAAKR